MNVIVSWAIENNLVYLRSILAGSMTMIIFWSNSGWLMIMIVSWAIENNLVYFDCSVIVSWAIENNKVYLRDILVGL